jgi:CheY-like chemotaxis protein
MSISRSIIEMMGGTIELQSEEGKGSTCTFGVWLQAEQAPPDSDEAPSAQDLSLTGKHALLVDDIALNRMIVMELFADTGLQIDEASDGLEGVVRFKASESGHYDVIFMDVQMPTMDGHEATRAIRALERGDARTVPVVAMTANAFTEDIRRALESGMNAHLAKPLELDKLYEVLSRFLRT